MKVGIIIPMPPIIRPINKNTIKPLKNSFNDLYISGDNSMIKNQSDAPVANFSMFVSLVLSIILTFEKSIFSQKNL